MSAYNIAKELSLRRYNCRRQEFVRDLAKKSADFLGYQIIMQNVNVDEKYGNANYLICSGHKSPLLVVAHYDAFVIDKKIGLTTPGANDNGSGVGVVFSALEQLKGYPIDFVFLGAEEIGHFGAKQYLAEMENRPRAVINLDTCGSGGDFGILIPCAVYVAQQLLEIDKELNRPYLEIAKKYGYKVCEDDPLATGDHCRFIEAGIPSTTIQGENKDFLGIENGQYVREKIIMHTDRDTIERVDPVFLEEIVRLLVQGSKRLLSNQ